MKTVSVLVGLFVTLPIWYFLLYRILESINASELTWFLFWIYIPAGIFVQVVQKVYEKSS